MKSFKWFLSYIFVAFLGLSSAFLVSIKFMAPARSQNTPSAGDLPPEFMKEIESTQVPSSEKKAAPEKAVSATPVTPKGEPVPEASPAPGSNPEPIPPPPTTAVSDGATADVSTSSEYSYKPNFSYDPTGRRDPFLPFRIIQNLTMDTKKENKILEPLQRFDIEKIKVIGIIWDVKKPRAMVKDPDGVVHTIVKDSKIGRNEGFVAAIREGEVVIIENRVENGKVVTVPNIMELRK